MARLVFLFKAVSKALILLTVGFFLFSWGEFAYAETASTRLKRRLERERSRMDAIQQELTRVEEEKIELKADEAKVIQDLDRLNFRLNRSRSALRQIRSEMADLQGRMDRLDSQRKALAEEIPRSETYALRRLRAYYKLTHLGVAQVLLSAESLFDLRQTRVGLERILKHDFELWDRLTIQKEELDTLSQELTARRADQDRLLMRYEKEEASLARQRANRAELLETIRAKQELRIASIASLQRASQELDQTIASLERDLEPFAASPRPSSTPFAELKGSLPMPVQGKLVGLFGPYEHEGDYNIKSFRSGVNIMARLGSPVHAVCDGRVVYSDWFKGYGNIMIIDHGEDYYTLSAQLEETYKSKGDPVKSGEVIATFGDTAALTGPGLYFEIRHHGRPIDPAVWFKK